MARKRVRKRARSKRGERRREMANWEGKEVLGGE